MEQNDVFFVDASNPWVVGGDGVIVARRSVAGAGNAGVLVKGVAVVKSYAGPFSRETSTRFELANASSVKLEIFNYLGRKVRVLMDGETAPGAYTKHRDGRDYEGRLLGAGTYYYRVEADGIALTKKMSFRR